MGPGAKARRQRTRERRAAEYRAKLALVRAAHPAARCGNCHWFEKHPYHADNPPQFICRADSDFSGYAIVPSDGLCPGWQGKKS